MAFRNPLGPGSITSAFLATGAVVQDKIADGAIVGTKLAVGALDAFVITGAVIRTAAAGARWVISTNPKNIIQGFSGLAAESSPANITVDNDGTKGFIALTSPVLVPPGSGGAYPPARLELSTNNNAGSDASLDVYSSFAITTHQGATLQEELRVTTSATNVKGLTIGKGIGKLRITEMQFSVVQVTFNNSATAQTVVPHGFPAGSQPQGALVCAVNSTALFGYAGTIDATNITIGLRRADNTLTTGNFTAIYLILS